MSIAAIQAMVYEGGHIEVLRGPTPQYEEYISVCRANGLVVKLAGTLSREMLNDLVEANFVERDGPENERNVTIKLTDEGREARRLHGHQFAKAQSKVDRSPTCCEKAHAEAAA